jgi:hypothetical protein
MKEDRDCTFIWNSKGSSNNNLVNQPFSGSVVPNIIQFNCTLAKLKFRLQSHALCLLSGEMRPKLTLPKEHSCLAIYHKYRAGTK